MYIDVKNENYGYSVATHGDYVAAGNPRIVRYNVLTASLYQTGTVDVFRYDHNTDTHLYVETLWKPVEEDEAILLAAESASVLSSSLSTEEFGLDWASRFKDIRVDYLQYWTPIESAYGHVVDWYDKRLAVGCPYSWDRFVIGSQTFDFSSSCVDVWDYTYSQRNNYTYNFQPNVVGYGFTGSIQPTTSSGNFSSLDFGTVDLTTTRLYYENVWIPEGYDYLVVSVSSSFQTSSMVVSRIPVSPDGQHVTYAITASLTASIYSIQYQGLITNEIRHYHIANPDTTFSESFGHAVSINQDWLAIGSPFVSSSKGAVYLYKNNSTGSNLSWSLYQKLEPTSLVNGQKFGWDVALNKSLSGGSCRNRLLVGCGAANNNNVYLFELSGSSWFETYQFHQDTSSISPLTFNTSSYPILLSASYQTSSFGWSVAIWEDTVLIGAPTERVIFEFTGSQAYEQGTAYIFERCDYRGCPVTASDYRLAQKIYGDKYTLKNNRLGYSVSMYGTNMLIGIPKRDVESMTSCYIRGSLSQELYCNADLENSLNGQWMYLTRNTSSMEWINQKVFQKKKRFMSPYRSFAEDLSVGDQSIVIGAPMLMTDLGRQMDIVYTSSLGMAMDDVMGKAYIYNLWNYKNQFYVGNVFYRNGTIVVNTSGSAFEGLYFNPTTPYTYEYLLNYQSRHTIYEKQVVCTVDPGEFNVSTNPTAVMKASSSLDLNRNGGFDFQDVDVLLRYMQYKNSTTLGGYSFDWSSSIIKNDDEVSFYNYNASQWSNTDSIFSASLKRFENVDTWYADLLDFNDDNKIDINDMLILWKYFSKRLNEKNYLSYINSNCERKQVNSALMYLDSVSKRDALPMINTTFSDYDQQCCVDRTGSYLSPMVTTIGLYSGLDLVAVAKVGAPIKLPKTLPINFVVKMDF